MADLNGTGKKQAYYRMQTWRKMSHEEFVKKCTYPGSGVSRAMMDAVLTAVAEELPRLMGMGYSVRIDGLGTFNAKLGVREDKEQDSFEEGEQKRNAKSIEVNGIGFRADKELVSKTDRECDLERGGVSRLRVSKYSLEQRMALAKNFVEQNAFMRVMDYVGLTGLSHSKASIELRQLCERPDAGFKAQGRGSHRVYVRAN
jgi:predicted histone-like DNA-binding protein